MNSLLIGHLTKHISTNYPQSALWSRLENDVLYVEAMIKSLNAALGRFIKLSSLPNARILVVCFCEDAKKSLMTMKLSFPRNFYFLNHKWVAGILSNGRTVRHNVERFFIEGQSFSTKGRRKTSQKIYRGLQGMIYNPTCILCIGRSLDGAISEAYKHGMRDRIIASQDTNCDWARKIFYPIMMNDDNDEFNIMILNIFMDRLRIIWSKKT